MDTGDASCKDENVLAARFARSFDVNRGTASDGAVVWHIAIVRI